jgi:GTP-binding protein
MRALRALERCDLAFILIDADEGITEQDTKVIGYCMESGRGCLLLINKWDLIKDDTKRQKRLREEVERATNFIGFAPMHHVSALTGSGVTKLFPMVDQVYRQYGQEFSTSQLNKVLNEALAAHTPPMHQGRRLKFYYVTQVATKPPTFVTFVNYPKGVHFSYYRFLVNQFREQLGLDKTPLKILLRERKRKQYGE